jgi:hypothetical protein
MTGRLFSLAILGLAITVAGCRHDHDHATEQRVGVHGGSVLETGNPNLLVEYVHRPAEAQIVLYLLDGQLQPVTAPPGETVEPPVINLIVNGQPEQLQTSPLADTPMAFQATHDAFRTEDFRARANVFVGEQAYAVDLIEDHHHHHH